MMPCVTPPTSQCPLCLYRPFFRPQPDAPWASGNAPISRFPAEGVVTDVTDAVFHVFRP